MARPMTDTLLAAVRDTGPKWSEIPWVFPSRAHAAKTAQCLSDGYLRSTPRDGDVACRAEGRVCIKTTPVEARIEPAADRWKVFLRCGASPPAPVPVEAAPPPKPNASAVRPTRAVPRDAGPRVDRARTNRDPAELARKRALLKAPHVAPLTAYVERLRAGVPGARIPDFDPTEAGIDAPILLLLEAPGPMSTAERGGSGFISPDNNDLSAQNMWNLLREAGIDRSRDVVTWNVVPWYIGDDSAIRAAEANDLADAGAAIRTLVSLLPNLRLAVLIGSAAQRGWARLGVDLPTIISPHPSQRSLASRPHYRGQILAALREARAIATES